MYSRQCTDYCLHLYRLLCTPVQLNSHLLEKVTIIKKQLGNVVNDTRDVSEKLPSDVATENVEDETDVKEKSSEVEKDKEELNTCNLCDFKTNSKQGLKSHKTKKHKEITSHCGFCNLDFTSNREFHVHMSSFHSGMSPISTHNFPPRFPRTPISFPRYSNGFCPPNNPMGPRW